MDETLTLRWEKVSGAVESLALQVRQCCALVAELKHEMASERRFVRAALVLSGLCIAELAALLMLT